MKKMFPYLPFLLLICAVIFAQPASAATFTITPQDATFTDTLVQANPAPAAPEEPATPMLSPPYSSVADGTFWSMTPGETDDAVIWDILMQPITIYDGGEPAGTKSHAYMRENPDGTGARVAQLHQQSQGVHVIGEVNEHGYVLIEAFSNYDPDFRPKTDEEKAHAFDLKQGYVRASRLKTIEVETNIAMVIDKKTQRMAVFIGGKRVTEFLISTGLIADGKYFYETIAGEFITASYVDSFDSSGGMICRMGIRINGGTLLHEVPHYKARGGKLDYSSFEPFLGTKASHGCVRIQRELNADGYNHEWLWDMLRSNKGEYKVIIWDDLGRVDI